MKKIILGFAACMTIASSVMVAKDKVYAIVNGDKITGQTIAVVLKNPKANFETLPADQKKNILNRVIEQKLLSQNAMTTNVVNDPIYKQTLKSLKQDLALQVWMQKESKKIEISNKEIKSFYDKDQRLSKVTDQIKAKHILVADEKSAKDIISTLNKTKNIKAKFIKLAKEKSTGPSGKNGGELGWFALEAMVPEFSAAAKKLSVGTFTTSPVKTKFGYHVIYVEDKKKGPMVDFNKVKPQIKQAIGQDKLVKHIQKIANKLKNKAKIEYK